MDILLSVIAVAWDGCVWLYDKASAHWIEIILFVLFWQSWHTDIEVADLKKRLHRSELKVYDLEKSTEHAAFMAQMKSEYGDQ